ncbi:SHOCT domain-containing protein [Acidithiobacillus ferrivorans]|nr:SHOCT domain-containing protein [Acidithiobacillus ferrivorans]
MNHTDAARRKKGIRMVGMTTGLMMEPVWALAQTVAITSQAPVYSQTVPPAAYYYGPGPGYYGPGMMDGFGLFWGLLCLLALVGIVGAVAFLIRGAFACRHRLGCRSTA